MTHARELVELYRRFYRVQRPFSASSYALVRPVDIIADTLLTANQRLFDSAEALIEIARGQLNDRLESSETNAVFIRGQESEQAMRQFCEKFVNDLFIGVFNGDVAALRGKQLNLLRSACEVLYLDMRREERAARGRDADEADEDETEA